MAVSLDNLNRAKYAGLDFDTHVDDLRARIQVKFAADYNDFALASMGMMLLDIIAFGLDTLSFYLDRRASDNYLQTARTRRAVSRLSRQLGYKMRGSVAASTDLNVSVTSAKTFTVALPVGFQFEGPNNLTFEVAEAVQFSPAEQSAGTVKQVPVYEGVSISESFVSDGTPNQVFELARVPDGQYVASGSVTVLVDGASFEEKDFLTFEAIDQFEIGLNDDPPTVRFGDGVAGNIPAKNASIVVTYVATSGKAGNIAANTIQSEVTPLVVVGETISLSINNPQRSSGGDDWESLDSAKSFAGRVFKSRQVAVTQGDYEALAGSYADPVFGRVAVAQAISSRSAENDLALQSFLLTISSALTSSVATIRTEVSAASDAGGTLYQIMTDLVDILSSLDRIAASVSTIDTQTEATISGIRSNKNISYEITAQANNAKTDVTDGKAAVDASAATAGEKTTINGYFDAIDALLDSIKSSASTVASTADTQIGALGLVRDEVDKIGTSTIALQPDGSDTELKICKDAADDAVALVGEKDEDDLSLSTGLFLVFAYTLANVADVLDPALPGESAAIVAQALADIETHVDKFLSADCKANLVTVPVLVRDSAGFYTEPSNGLVRALQDYLDARKEVTQTVSVVSGGNFLVFPVIVARLGVEQGYSLEKSRTAAESAIDGVLRDRKFGESLYISDLTEVILAVAGVAFVNIVITGHTTLLVTTTQTNRLDDEGNLIIPTSEVITKAPGSVTVTPEVVQQ